MMKEWLTQLHRRWISRRIPPSSEVRLTRHNIFIMPTWLGINFVLCCMFLFVLGINYQNNLIILLSLLLVSIGVTTIITTHRNVSGSQISQGPLPEYFAQQPQVIRCQLAADTSRYGFNLSIGQGSAWLASFEQAQTIDVPIGSLARGRHHIERVTVASNFPFGLFKAWSHVDLAINIIVFPLPLAIESSLRTHGNDQTTGNTLVGTGDDLHSLDLYRQGESLRRVAWKQVAQGRGMLTKQFEQIVGEAQWLDYGTIEGHSTEQKLSHLCYLVIEYSKLKQPFGLVLPNKKLAVGYGEHHRLKALTMLALYGGQS